MSATEISESNIVEQARDNLSKFGITAEEPDRVDWDPDLSGADVFEAGGLTAATYNCFNDRIELFDTVAKANAIAEFITEEDKDWLEENLSEIQDYSPDDSVFRQTRKEMLWAPEDPLTGERYESPDFIKNKMILGEVYESLEALNKSDESEQFDLDLLEKFDSVEEQRFYELTTSIEHELIHKRHADRYTDPGEGLTNLKSLKEGQKILRDIDTGDSELDKVLRRQKNLNLFFEERERYLSAAIALYPEFGNNVKEEYESRVEEIEENLEDIEPIKPPEKLQEIYEEDEEVYNQIIQFVVLNSDQEIKESKIRENLEGSGLNPKEYAPVIMDYHEERRSEKERRSQIREEQRKELKKAEDAALEKIEEKAKANIAETQSFLEPIEKRNERFQDQISVPSEAFAHFWTSYREENLEREEYDKRKETVRSGYSEGEEIAEIMEELYDEFRSYEGDDVESVRHVFELEEEYMDPDNSLYDKLRDLFSTAVTFRN